MALRTHAHENKGHKRRGESGKRATLHRNANRTEKADQRTKAKFSVFRRPSLFFVFSGKMSAFNEVESDQGHGAPAGDTPVNLPPQPPPGSWADAI